MIVKKYFDLSDRHHRTMYDMNIIRTVAVIGAGNGCGCTHFSIAYANYMRAMTGEKTALLMSDGNGHMNSIRSMCEVKEISVSRRNMSAYIYGDCFEFYGIDYYSWTDEKSIEALFSNDYKHIIIDYGDKKEGISGDILLMTKRVVIGSLMPWKCKEFDSFCENNNTYINKADWNFFMRNGEISDAKYFRDKYGIRIKKIPEFSNPYRIGRKEKDFFENEGRCIFCS